MTRADQRIRRIFERQAGNPIECAVAEREISDSGTSGSVSTARGVRLAAAATPDPSNSATRDALMRSFHDCALGGACAMVDSWKTP